MRMTINQMTSMMTYIQSTLDDEDYQWFKIVINLMTLSLFEFNRMKKIMPLNISEDIIILDEFNVKADKEVDLEVNNLLKQILSFVKLDKSYNSDKNSNFVSTNENISDEDGSKINQQWKDYLNDHDLKLIQNESNEGSTDVIPRISTYYGDPNNKYHKLTLWHYIFSSRFDILKSILITSVHDYMKNNAVRCIPFLINKGNGYEFKKFERISNSQKYLENYKIISLEEFAIMMNFLINNGVISWR